MLKTAVILCSLVLVVSGQGFWLLAKEQLNEGDGRFKKSDCMSYFSAGILTRSQLSLCEEDSLVLAAISKGLKRAILECQLKFKEEKWNCTIFKGRYLLGKGIETRDSKEGSYIRTLIDAAILYDIADACRENLLPKCPCYTTQPYIRRLSNGTILLNGCGDNLDYAAEKTTLFTASSSSSQPGTQTLQDLVRNHNARLAQNVVNNTFIECKCHGFSVACPVKTCVRRMKPFKDSGNSIHSKYLSSIKVRGSTSGGLESSGPADDPTPDDLVYSEDSPNYCNANSNLNIPGTRGRTCDPNTVGSGSCDLLCCGRGYYSKYKSKAVRKCGIFPVNRNGKILGFENVCSTKYVNGLEYMCR